jgi:CBS domain-containing protein
MGMFSDKKVEDAMTTRPRAVTPETSAADAARAMATEDVGALPVVSEGRLAGIVTDRDLALRVLAQDADPSTPVGGVLSGELVTIRANDTLEHAMDLMAHHQLRRLPVVGDADELVGMIAQADIARIASDRDTGDVVGAISDENTDVRL